MFHYIDAFMNQRKGLFIKKIIITLINNDKNVELQPQIKKK